MTNSVRTATLLKQRSLMIAHHANSPLDCYSLSVQVDIQKERQADLGFLNGKIDTLMGGES